VTDQSKNKLSISSSKTETKVQFYSFCNGLGPLTTSDAELIQKYVKFWTLSRRKLTVKTVKRLHLYWYSNFPGAFTHVIFIAS